MILKYFIFIFAAFFISCPPNPLPSQPDSPIDNPTDDPADDPSPDNPTDDPTNEQILTDPLQNLVFKKDEGKIPSYNQNLTSTYHRIPTLLSLPDNTLLAFADRRYNGSGDIAGSDTTTFIEVWCKKSTNNGESWDKAIRVTPKTYTYESSNGDAGVVYDSSSGDIIVMVIGKLGLWYGTQGNTSRLLLIRSKDKGMTWEEPVDITSQLLGDQYFAGFVASGNGVQISTGRLLFCLTVRNSYNPASEKGKLINFAIYSDDSGKTWKVSNSPTDEGIPLVANGQFKGYGDEAKICEMGDGRLMMLIRPSGTEEYHYQKMVSYSSDYGVTWTKAVPHSDLPASASNGDLKLYTSKAAGWEQDILLCAFGTLPYSQKDNGITKVLNKSGNGYLSAPNKGANPPGYPAFFYSTDYGKTWKGRCWHEGASGYSSFAFLSDGTIGVLTEHGGGWGTGDIYFFKTNLEWISNGQLKPQKAKSN